MLLRPKLAQLQMAQQQQGKQHLEGMLISLSGTLI